MGLLIRAFSQVRAREGEGRNGSRKEVNRGCSVLLLRRVIRYFELLIRLLLYLFIYFSSFFFDATVSGFIQDGDSQLDQFPIETLKQQTQKHTHTHTYNHRKKTRMVVILIISHL